MSCTGSSVPKSENLPNAGMNFIAKRKQPVIQLSQEMGEKRIVM
jgi:hypothetical protein